MELPSRHICITFIQCWPNVEDVGPTLYKCYTNVLCSLGYYQQTQHTFVQLLYSTLVPCCTNVIREFCVCLNSE